MSTQRKMVWFTVIVLMTSVACLSTLPAQDALLGWKSEGRGTHEEMSSKDHAFCERQEGGKHQ